MFGLKKKLRIVLSIALSIVFVSQLMVFQVSAAVLTKNVTQYSSYFLVDKNNENQIGKIGTAGNLTGRATSSDPWMSVNGWFDYQITADTAGWYELILTYDPTISGGDGHEFILDGTTYLNPFPKALTSTTSKVGNVWLTVGNHTFRIQRWVWTGFGAIKSFEFKAVSTTLAKNIRVAQDVGTPYGANGGAMFLKTNETFNMNIFSGGSATGTFDIEVYNKATNNYVKTYSTTISSSTSETKQTVAVSCANAGTYYLKYKAAGSYVASTEGLLDVEFTVIDATPVDVTGNLNDVTKTQVGSEIDCATTMPNYIAGSNDSAFGAQQRVITVGFGSYRETGDNGFLTSATNPNYVTYTMPTLDPDKHYVAEIDYPDDAARSFGIVMRQDGETYGMAGGIDTGYEYPLTNTIKTFSFNFYMLKQGQPRIGVMSNQTGLRAAISKIRIYEVTANPYLKASSAGRDFGFFFEEGRNYTYLFGAKDTSKEENMKAAERWAQNMRYLGGNVMLPAAAAYQQSLAPSTNYDLIYSDLHTADYFKMLLIYADKYSLNVIADFHRDGNEMTSKLKYTSYYQKNLLTSKDGTFLDDGAALNPIYPDNQTWMDGYLTEFATRYKDFSSFKGISIRSMVHQNTGFTNFQSLDYGYDDYTAGQFCAYLGITDPGTPSTRYSTFTNLTYKQRWIDWRASKINDAMQRYTNTLKAVRSDLTLYSIVSGFVDSNNNHNVDALKEAGIKDNSISGFQWIYGEYQYGRKSVSTTLTNSEYAWNNNKTLLTDNDCLLNFPNSPNYCMFANYLEDGGNCMKAADIGLPASSAWISEHAVPSGRNYLERYALALAKSDAQLILNGGNTYFYDQPIVREFMQEYRQLPKAKFSLINTTDNDVVVRDYQGTDYNFYLVNQTNSSKTCTINFGQTQTITQLSTGTQTSTTNNKITITLEAYQVKVFKSQGVKIVDADGIKPGYIVPTSITDDFENATASRALWQTRAAVGSPSTKVNDFSINTASGNSYLNPVYQQHAPNQSYITTIKDSLWNYNKLQVLETKVLLPEISNNTYVDTASNIFLYYDPATRENVRLGFTLYSGALTGKIYNSSQMAITNGVNYSSQRGGYPIDGFSTASWMTVKAKYDYSVANTVTISFTFTCGTTVSTCSVSFSASGVYTLSSFRVGFGSLSWNASTWLTYYDDVNLQFAKTLKDNFEDATASNAMWETVAAVSSPSTKINDFSINTASGNAYLKPSYQQYSPYQSYITTIKDDSWNFNKLKVFETKILLPAMNNNSYIDIASNTFLYYDPATKNSVRLGFTMYSGGLIGKIYNSSGMTITNGTGYDSDRVGYPISNFSTTNWMTVKSSYDYSVANTITVTFTFINGGTVTNCSMSFSPSSGSLATGFKVGFGSHAWNDSTWVTYYDDVNIQFEKSVTDYFETSTTSNALWESIATVASPSTKIDDFLINNSGGNYYLKPAYQQYSPYQSYITTIKDNSWNQDKLQSLESKILMPAMNNNGYIDIASNTFLYYDPVTNNYLRLGFTMYSGGLIGKIYNSSGITVTNGTGYDDARLGYPISNFNTANWMTVKATYDYSVANTITLNLAFTNSGTVTNCSVSFTTSSGSLASGFKVGFGSHAWNDSTWVTYYDDVKLLFEE